MIGLPYNGHPSDDIQTLVKLLIPIQEFDGKHKEDLTKHLRKSGIVSGYIDVELNEETKNIFRVTFIPTTKSGKTKPALIEVRNQLAKEINNWYRQNLKP